MHFRPRLTPRHLGFVAAAATAGSAIFGSVAIASAADVASTITGFKYDPSPLRVKAGDKVNYTNKDAQPHTITSKPAGLFDAPITANGGLASITAPAKDGIYDIICTLHPAMLGQLIVGNPPGAPGTGTGLAVSGSESSTLYIAIGFGLMAVSAAGAAGFLAMKRKEANLSI